MKRAFESAYTIPMYQLAVRHPQYGWQVIATFTHERLARQAYYAIADEPSHDLYPLMIALHKVTGNQTWSVLCHRDGTYNYSPAGR